LQPIFAGDLHLGLDATLELATDGVQGSGTVAGGASGGTLRAELTIAPEACELLGVSRSAHARHKLYG
jgi:hypothetical protein